MGRKCGCRCAGRDALGWEQQNALTGPSLSLLWPADIECVFPNSVLMRSSNGPVCSKYKRPGLRGKCELGGTRIQDYVSGDGKALGLTAAVFCFNTTTIVQTENTLLNQCVLAILVTFFVRQGGRFCVEVTIFVLHR